MNQQQFITEIEAYYGPYPKGQRRYIDSYLRKLSDRSYMPLFVALLRTYSSRYGKAPDIEAFESVRGEVLDELEQNLSVPAIEDQTEYIDKTDMAKQLAEWLTAKMSKR